MKKIKFTIYIFLAVSLLAFGSCSRTTFAALNSNPDAVTSVPPEFELTTGQMAVYQNSFEAYYDFNKYIKPWAQVFVDAGGNLGNLSFSQVGNGNQRWSNFYGNVGPPLVDVQHLISLIKDTTTAATYVDLNAIAGINLVEYAFYTSDPNGSMPFSQAFQARYTDSLTPAWDTQEALFDTLDARLKMYVSVLETSQPVAQNTGGQNDLIFQGNVNNWIKSANSLRLRIAMRLIKQNPTQLTKIANEVLADPVGLIDNTSDEWVFYQGTNSFEGGNYNPFDNGQNPCCEKHVVDFFNRTGDPRERNILQPAVISTQDIFDSAQAQGVVPASASFDGQVYRGQYASPDSAKDVSKTYYFTALNFSYKNSKQTGIHFPSLINPYLVYAPYNGGNGLNVIPVITFADVCFMRAELVLRGLSNDGSSAQLLYNAGVTASIQDYDAWSKLCATPNYVALGASEISNYLQQPGVSYQPSNALEQVLVQEYINDYLNCNEAWALIKRTGYPSPTGVIMPLEYLTTGGNPLVMPRRYVPNFPLLGDLNYTNAYNAIEAELQQPGFGQANDITGKVWWDQ